MLFAVISATVLAHLSGFAVVDQTEPSLAARAVILVFGAAFLLGTSFSRATALRRDPDTGAIAPGGLGLFFAAAAALQVSGLLAIRTGEMVLLVPAVLLAVYAFAAMADHARFRAPAAALLVAVVATIAFSDTPFADPMADKVGRLLDLPASAKTPGYLEEPGGAFAAAAVAPAVLALFTLAMAQ